MGAATPAADTTVETPPTGKGFDVIEDANQEVVLRVGASSDVKALASSVSFALQDSRRVTLRGVGAGAVNQMAKASAVARGYVASRGVDLVVRPGFTTVQMRDHDDPSKMVDTTAVIFVLSVN